MVALLWRRSLLYQPANCGWKGNTRGFERFDLPQYGSPLPRVARWRAVKCGALGFGVDRGGVVPYKAF